MFDLIRVNHIIKYMYFNITFDFLELIKLVLNEEKLIMNASLRLRNFGGEHSDLIYLADFLGVWGGGVVMSVRECSFNNSRNEWQSHRYLRVRC